MPVQPLFLPSHALHFPSPSPPALSKCRSPNPTFLSLPKAHLPLNPGFRIPNLRGRSLHFALLASSAAIISVDVLHTYSHSIRDQINLAVPDALASTAATAVFCTALESRFNPFKRKTGHKLKQTEHNEWAAPFIDNPTDCQTLFENLFQQAAVHVGVTAFVVCQGTSVLYAMGDVRAGAGPGRIIERVHEIQEPVYIGNFSVRSGFPFGQRVIAVYLLPVGKLVVGFGSQSRLSVCQRRYLRALAEDSLLGAVGEENLTS